jgi:hypothetical protein
MVELSRCADFDEPDFFIEMLKKHAGIHGTHCEKNPGALVRRSAKFIKIMPLGNTRGAQGD